MPNTSLPAMTPETLALLKLFEQSAVLLGVKDAVSGHYVHVCDRMAGLLGRARTEVIGASDADILSPDEAALLKAADQTVLKEGVVQWSEHRLMRGGKAREFSVNRLLWSDGAQRQFLVSAWVELSENRQREQQLKQALTQLEQQQQALEALRRETQDHSLRDGLTGLYQRAHFEDQLRRELDLSAREHREFALVSIAIDDLKEMSGISAAQAQTRVLEALGRLLRNNTRAMDAACRLEDGRFAVLLSGVGLATAHSRMEGFRRQCATQIVVIEGQDLGFTVSMGVASFPHTAQTEDQLIHSAAVALSEAQRRGGNQVTLASIKFSLG